MDKIIVLAKEIIRLENDFQINDNEIDDRYFERELNEWDRYALEEAIQIREQQDGVEVVTVTIGPFFSVDTINRCLAHGADRALRIWDDTLEELSPQDPSPIARLLSRVVERENPDLILAGAQSDDESHGATGVMVAEQSEFNWVAVVDEITIEDDDAIQVERELEGGFQETTRVELPALVTVQNGINEPRYVSMRSIHRQSSDDIETLDLDDLDLDPAVLNTDVQVVDLRKPGQSQETSYLEGETDTQANDLIEILDSEGVLA